MQEPEKTESSDESEMSGSIANKLVNGIKKVFQKRKIEQQRKNEEKKKNDEKHIYPLW